MPRLLMPRASLNQPFCVGTDRTSALRAIASSAALQAHKEPSVMAAVPVVVHYLSPVRAPAIATDPVVFARLRVGAIASDTDRVVKGGAVGRIHEDAATVGLKLRRDADRAANGSTGCYLRHHLLRVCLIVCRVDATPLHHTVTGEVVCARWRAHCVAAFAPRLAIDAHSFYRTFEIGVEILGLVVLACLVDTSMLGKEWCHLSWIASKAAPCTLALVSGGWHTINQMLRTEECLWPRVLGMESETVVERGQRSVRPARAAVLRDVLVGDGEAKLILAGPTARTSQEAGASSKRGRGETTCEVATEPLRSTGRGAFW
eukprot:CAMPEP_0174707356 /NCGR_PEP_ID=MMETSP1094-20130205/9893_1 /TAXON_ID=156173 /ORGANISM="Chrysochromulina brevifilum, Strain UTEX LB 985" /LENGTH=316 /DNA_ID=CAMNT_0015905721 /DNA_START=245 /DNA_END=1197 /DNA_ORIENTATION=-